MSTIRFMTSVAVLGLLASGLVNDQQSKGEGSPARQTAAEAGNPQPPAADSPESAAAPAPESPATKGAKPGAVPSSTASKDSASEAPTDQLPQRKLQFSFRHQRWIDVLEWLAEQSNLSLVLDAPPPGSFNYSDSREYTPLEAIDLVNGVLASKGYTLVRRDRMLTLVNLAGGVSSVLLPQVKLEDIDDRGKFEMVSVAFPIGNRKMDAVSAEIQVLLGPYGKISPLAASGQILVTDRAGIMRTIGAVIKSIPEPKPPQKAAAKKPEKPELGVYALGGSDPAAALETLKALFDNARFVFDKQSDHINAYATPTQHAAIAKIFEQMKSGTPEGNRPRLEVYPLPNLDPATRQDALSNLAIVAPDARMRYDDQAERLFVWARPVLQDAIRTSIVKLLQVRPPGGSRLLQVYNLQRTDPTTLSTLLQATLPRARVTVDGAGRRLIVHASQQDQQTVAQLVEQMDAEPAEERRAVLRIYPVDRRLADRVTPLLTQLVPEAKATIDPKLGRVSVVATPGDQIQVESILTRLAEGTADLQQPTVEVVKVPRELRERFEAIRALLEGQIPEAKLLWDPESLELTVWATAEDHARVGAFLDQMSRRPASPPEKPTVEVLKVPRDLRDRFEAIHTMLTAEIPKAQMVWNPDTLELTVWAMPREQTRVREILDHLASQPAAEPERPTLEVHAVPKTLRDRFESIRTLLTAEVPKARLTWDPKTSELRVWALPDDHARIREVLAQVAKQPAAEPTRPTLEVHAVPKTMRDRFESIRTLLTAEVPKAKLFWNPETLELSVWALPDDHARINEVLAQVAKQPAAPPARPTVIVHTLPKALRDRFESIQTLLTTQVPKAKLVWDPKSLELTVWALPDDHLRVGELLEQISRHPPTEKQRQLAAYPMTMVDLPMAVTMLQNVASEAQISADTKGRRILVWATPEEQQTIEQAIRAMGASDAAQGARSYMSHPVRGLDLALATRLLTERLPGITFEQDVPRSALIALASAAEHQQIDDILEQMQTAPPTANSRQVVIYPIEARDAETVAQVLTELLPAAQVVGKRYVPNVSVRGTDQEQRLAKEVVDQWIENSKKPTQTVAKLYTMKSALAADVVPQLQRLVPTAVLVAGTSPHTILARAKEEDHELLEKLVPQLDQPATDERVVEVYELPGGNVTSLRGLLDAQTAAQIQTVPAGRDRVIVRAAPSVQAKIKAVVDKVAPAMDSARLRTVSYPLAHADPQEAWTVLRAIVPQAVIVVQPKSKSLAVSAVDQDHRRIAAALREIDRPGEKGKQHQATVVPIDKANPQQLLSLLQRIFAREQDLAFSYDDKTHSILIVGNPDRLEESKRIIASADRAEPGRQPHVEVYPLRNVQPQEAAVVLRGIVPTATIVVRPSSRSLAVSSDGQGQRQVADAIQAMERATEHTGNQQVSVIPIVEAEPQTLLRLLQTKYASETDLSFSYDTGTRSILVVGPADRQEEIKKIIAAADSPEAGHQQRVVVYPLGRINGSIAQQMVNQLMAKERVPVTLSYEPGGNQLVVLALDSQHGVIREALEQLQPPETDFEVFALHAIDPLVAEDAVIGLFAGALEGGSAPVVDVDQDNDRLYIRATPKQLVKIRDLLTKMGEQQLNATGAGSSREKMRFVPLSGDEQEAIKSIQSVWPKLRNNRLRVLERGHLPEALPGKHGGPPAPARKLPTHTSPPPKVPGNSSSDQHGPAATERVGIWLWEGLLETNPMGLFCQVIADSSAREQVKGPQARRGSSRGPHQLQLAGKSSKPPVRHSESKLPPRPNAAAPTAAAATPAPVYIVPGDQGVTIMSEDTTALDQLERLLSVLAKPQSRGSRRFFVYPLKSASAPRLAKSLNKIYRYIPSTGRGRTSFVADERLNALVVFASRSDRQEIEGLLRILDVEQTPDMQATHQPVVIPLKHAHAVTVEKQLRLLYKTQLTAGGKQPVMEIPSGVNARAAAMIEQINAVRQGPLMTLGTDEDTNSILVVAPASLIEEVRKFVEELDQAASDHPRQAVQIVPLRNTNAAAMDRALQRMLRTRRRRR